jgi:hypothetical protein
VTALERHLARLRVENHRRFWATAQFLLALHRPRMICAWCRADLGAAVGCPGDSHGICAACQARYFPERPAA